MNDDELKQQVKNILMHCNHNNQLVFQWCLEEMSYWTENAGKIKVFKDSHKFWVTEIFENQVKLIQCKSLDKNASMVGACLLLADHRRVEVPVEHFD